MANIEITADQLYEAIGELRELRDECDGFINGPVSSPATTLWRSRTLALLRHIFDDGHYVVGTFANMTYPESYLISARERQNSFAKAHLPVLDAALREAQKKLDRMGTPQAPAFISSRTSLPQVDFEFVRDLNLRRIAARDYDELRSALHTGSLASTVLHAGSVLEAVVLDLLLQRGVDFEQVKNAGAAELYKRAVTEGALKGRAVDAAKASRQTRNLVHPAVEYREGALTQGDADLAVSLLKVMLEEIVSPG